MGTLINARASTQADVGNGIPNTRRCQAVKRNSTLRSRYANPRSSSNIPPEHRASPPSVPGPDRKPVLPLAVTQIPAASESFFSAAAASTSSALAVERSDGQLGSPFVAADTCFFCDRSAIYCDPQFL
ncbi:hypothetical protein AVEN_87156-1 [Araneus ventricosus]|uniref:Uncharacterized protein n=1 Tax=Araneus ventricosus TaxID=182803 RepID=A0A4Y2H3I1_ARAVE|nr:hypothetical protein AVEN_87156-1 [Araneus ventricosus]